VTANNGDCVELPVDIGRPSISEAYHARPNDRFRPDQRISSGDLIYRTGQRRYSVLRSPLRRSLRSPHLAAIGFNHGATATSAIWKSKNLMDVISALSP
jgi:hypothetical protein